MKAADACRMPLRDPLPHMELGGCGATEALDQGDELLLRRPTFVKHHLRQRVHMREASAAFISGHCTAGVGDCGVCLLDEVCLKPTFLIWACPASFSSPRIW